MLGLVRALTGNTKTFIRQEIQLAKTEVTEKVSRMGKNAATLAIGGAIAYAGLLALLIGLGWLAGYGLAKAGLNTLLANSLGIIAVGLVVIIIGAILLWKSIKTLSKESLTPEKTMYTLQELKSGPMPASEGQKQTPKPSSDELQARVEATEERMGETLDELGRRLSPSHLNAQVKHTIQAQPYRSGLIAMAVGVLSGLILRRRL
ncbi:MAG TPA: phage holin family protein [Clostridia bacterium]|nr:phage holin family protein [Clostridia bacterium]